LREWVSFPELKIKTIKAKIDKGARTSALHVSNIKIFKRTNKVTFTIHPVQRQRYRVINTSAFRKAQSRATKRSLNITNVSIHSLKHNYGARLRAAKVPEEDRGFLMGHKGKMRMTTYYSAPELMKMLDYSKPANYTKEFSFDEEK
jgi:hypothetical protein